MMQEPPFSLHLEPTEGCSLACSFCGISSIRDNGADAEAEVHGKNSAPYRFMQLDTVTRIVREVQRLGWNPRVELAMHGEPSMHPDLDTVIKIIRMFLPEVSIMVTTNGSGLIHAGKVDALFCAGLNTLAFDDYKHSAWREKINAILVAYAEAAHISLYRYPENANGNPHQRFHKKRIVVIRDISDATEGTHQLTNQGANSFAPVVASLQKRCAKPFRELSIRWDGSVALCCDDWKGVYKIGNVNNVNLDAIWTHPRFEAARRYLMVGDRASLQPCAGCNVITYRNGLLPDKKGQQTILPPDDLTRLVANEAMSGPVFSLKLMRGMR